MESSPESSPVKYVTAAKPPKQFKKEPGESEPQGNFTINFSSSSDELYGNHKASFWGVLYRIRYSWCRTRLLGLELLTRVFVFLCVSHPWPFQYDNNGHPFTSGLCGGKDTCLFFY